MVPIWVLVLCGFGLPIAGFLIAAIMSAGGLADDNDYDEGFADGVRFKQFGDEA